MGLEESDSLLWPAIPLTPLAVPSNCPQRYLTEAGLPSPLTLGTGMAVDLAEASGAGAGVVLATG